MPPDDHAQDTDTKDAGNHQPIAKQRFAGKNHGYLSRYCQCRQNYHVHLGVSKKPEQVLVQPVTSTGGCKKERGLEDPVQHDHHLNRKEHGECHQTQCNRQQHAPNGYRESSPGHTPCAHYKYSRHDIHGCDSCRDGKYDNEEAVR